MDNLNDNKTATTAPVSTAMPVSEVAPAPKIGKEQIDKALETLQKYKSGKANLEARIIECYDWYRMRYYKDIEDKTTTSDSASAWLFNSIANKHADAMDNMPEVDVLPREASDAPAAQILSSILPIIFERNDFEKTYSDIWDHKLHSGTGVYGIYWDTSKQNGLGDIAINRIDPLNLFWEPGITDIQRSKNLFHVELRDNELLKAQYPELSNITGSGTIEVAKYVYDDAIDTSNKSPVVDWYYKTKAGSKDILQYCKFCNGVVLFASENDPRFANGFYDHGEYPFVFDPLFSDEGTPCGFGYVDIMKDAQKQIDIINDNIIRYSTIATTPRFFVNATGNINEEEFADWKKSFIHISGSGNATESIKPVEIPTLPAIYASVLNNKIDELKETSGNRDFSQGGVASGVTAASAIAALQEAGSKLSRDMIKGSYRAFRQLNYLAIELIRQFYDKPRVFRITSPNGEQAYQEFTNETMQPQPQGSAFNVDLGYRLPIFDIDITAQKSSPNSKQAQNQLALQFYAQGFFAPQNSDAALATLNMMQFDGRDIIMTTIKQNGTMYDQLIQLQQTVSQLAQIVDAQNGTSILPQIGATQTQPGIQSGGTLKVEEDNSLTSQAKRRVADSTTPK